MCLFLFYINPYATDKEFYLIILNVRDEMYYRPTRYADFWPDHPDVFGGQDREHGKEGGTWFAINKTGKIGALMNVLQPDDEIDPNKKGRGFLVVDYLTGNEDCYKYMNKVCSEKDNYNGFTLVTLDISSKKSPIVSYFTNASSSTPTFIDSFDPEYYAFGNSISVEDPWPKVKYAKEKFHSIVRNNRRVRNQGNLEDGLVMFASDPSGKGVDENMKKQGRSKTDEFLRKLSATCVRMPEHNYGTRTQTVVLIEGSGKVHYLENNYCVRRADKPAWRHRRHTFQMDFKD